MNQKKWHVGCIVLLSICICCCACANKEYGTNADHPIQITIEELTQNLGKYEGKWITTQGLTSGPFSRIKALQYKEGEQRLFLDMAGAFEQEAERISNYYYRVDQDVQIQVTGKIETREETIGYTDEFETRYYLTDITALALVIPKEALAIHPQPTDAMLPAGTGKTAKTAVEVDFEELKQHAYLYDKKWVVVEAFLQDGEFILDDDILQKDKEYRLPMEGIAIDSFKSEKHKELAEKSRELLTNGNGIKVRVTGYFQVNPWEIESEGADCIQTLSDVCALDAIE